MNSYDDSSLRPSLIINALQRMFGGYVFTMALSGCVAGKPSNGQTHEAEPDRHGLSCVVCHRQIQPVNVRKKGSKEDQHQRHLDAAKEKLSQKRTYL